MIAAILAVIHVLLPQLPIDTITIVLIILALLPWLSPIFKSVEVPGVGKFDYQDLEKVKTKAKKIGLIPTKRKGLLNTTEEYLFEIARENPNLSLAGFRIELERHIRDMAQSYKIQIAHKNVRQILAELSNKRIINADEKEVLIEIIDTLDEAVYEAPIPAEVTGWIMETAPQLLHTIDQLKHSKK